jgi:hypothetical protein
VININKMSRPLFQNGVTTLIGIHRVFGDVIDVLFVEAEQFRWEGKNRVPIDRFMSMKSPSVHFWMEAQGQAEKKC